MTYTAQDAGAALSKVDGTSASLNFLHGDNHQELLLRRVGGKIQTLQSYLQINHWEPSH